MKALFLITFIALHGFSLHAQDLLSELEKQQQPDPGLAIATFKGSRIINGQSVETRRKGELEFIFAHRFGLINEGAHTLWGLDQSVTRLGLEYGISDRLGVGVGRTSADKTFDGYVRYKVLRQRKTVPVTVTAVGSVFYRTTPRNADMPIPLKAGDRLAYATQLLLARKFSSRFSFQLNPIYVHRNTVNQLFENNDDFALGFAGRFKLTPGFALTAEYLKRLNARPNIAPDYVRYDAVGIGVDIETGGHVFQILLTNTLGMFERFTISETNENFWDGDIHFGFNITRTFQIAGKR
ncbi:MAG: hypothetical protein KatS3mg032_0303 [Cyclobacteriaceae bacterium]|nr:MAG: hypothetical protein KatS3mg032_0303 [Cyclobacteriaceae bacterium]